RAARGRDARPDHTACYGVRARGGGRMKIIFPKLTDFMAELRVRGRSEVRLQHLIQHRTGGYGLDHITYYSLVTAEIPPGHRAEWRIPHGTVAHPLGATPDAAYQALQEKADRRHEAIRNRLQEADLTVLAGAFRPDADVIDG